MNCLPQTTQTLIRCPGRGPCRNASDGIDNRSGVMGLSPILFNEPFDVRVEVKDISLTIQGFDDFSHQCGIGKFSFSVINPPNCALIDVDLQIDVFWQFHETHYIPIFWKVQELFCYKSIFL